MIPHVRWTNDCSGKQDYDGEIISVSTRYWPDHTAHSSIILHLGPAEEDDGGGDYLVWAQKDFTALTELRVKTQVESWVKQQMRAIVNKLGGRKAFVKP